MNKPRKALIIEDELIVGEQIASIVSRDGIIPVRPATNVDEAVFLFRMETPDLLISDIRLKAGQY